MASIAEELKHFRQDLADKKRIRIDDTPVLETRLEIEIGNLFDERCAIAVIRGRNPADMCVTRSAGNWHNFRDGGSVQWGGNL